MKPVWDWDSSEEERGFHLSDSVLGKGASSGVPSRVYLVPGVSLATGESEREHRGQG